MGSFTFPYSDTPGTTDVSETVLGSGRAVWDIDNKVLRVGDGETVGGKVLEPLPTIPAPLQPLAKTLQKLNTARGGTAAQIKAIALIDSVSLFPWGRLAPVLSSAIGQEPPNGEITANIDASNLSAVTTSMDPQTATVGSYAITTTNFDKWFTGDILTLAADSEFPYAHVGTSFPFTRLVQPYFIRPDGGEIQFKVGGSLVGSPVDTSVGTPGDIGFLTYTQAVASTTVRVVSAGGPVELTGAFHEDSSRSRLNLYAIGKGGLSIATAMTYAQARANLIAYLAQIGPDLVVIEGKEDEATFIAAHTQLFDLLDTVAPLADKVCCGSTPICAPYASWATADPAQRRMNAMMEGMVLARANASKPYIYVDKYAPFVRGNDPATAAPFLASLGSSYYGDGLHIGVLGSAIANTAFDEALGLATLPWAKELRAVNNPWHPSRFAKNTAFGFALGQQLRIIGESFSVNWQWGFARSIAFGTDSDTLDANPVARFSNNVNQASNILPANTFLGVEADGFKWVLTSPTLATGFMDWQKANAPGAKVPQSIGLLRLPSFAKADLPNNAAWVGYSAICSDAAGATGPCVVHCTAAGVWKQDGGAAV